MVIPLLVVTTDVIFGELIRHNLEESGRYIVHVVDRIDDSDQHPHENDLSLAFLDTDASDEVVLKAGRALRRTNKHIRFIIASRGGWHAGLEELNPHGYLSKPVNLPDLSEIVKNTLPPVIDQAVRPVQAKTRPISDNSTVPPWLADVNRATQHLTRLTLKTSAQAALITRKDVLWAYAGGLPQSVGRELVDTVARYRDHRGESDLLRFVRLVSTNAEYMLYASRLADGMVLALIFNAETPFSTIRSQAGLLVRSLSSPPPAETQQPVEVDNETVPSMSFADILVKVPPPNPGDNISVASTPLEETNPVTPLQEVEHNGFSRELFPAVLSKSLRYNEQGKEVVSSHLSSDVAQVEIEATSQKKPKKKQIAPDTISDTYPRSAAETARNIVLEPVSPSVYNLTYACLLIPRLAEHVLASDLAERLTEWTRQICVKYGWRLENISVHPDYFQWIVNIPPATSPAYLMRIVRQQTSEKIFMDFYRFKKDNPSGDFWAVEYLIMAGTQSPSALMIREFIQQTQQRQSASHLQKS